MVCIFLATGFEEVEALAVVDLLRREKIDAKLISVTGDLYVASSHGIIVKADYLFDEVDYDKEEVIFLPGGIPGMPNLAAHKGLIELLKKFYGEGKRLAAICAAPSIYGSLGFLEGKKATCYPDFRDKLTGAIVSGAGVVTDGNITTGRGMGTAVDMGLELVRLIKGEKEMAALSEKIQKL